MPLPELVDYIREQTQQGATAEDLRVALMEAGWQELDIDNGLHDVAAGLHPATPGASIHEDLAQVRGLVAHLATRVKGIEARLASIGTVAQPAPILSLPSEYIGPERELTVHKGHAGLWHVVSLLFTLGLAVMVGMYATDLVARNALAPLDQIIIAAALAFFLLIASVVAMRGRHAWSASLFAAGAVALWATDAVVSWRVYHYMEWPTALAVGILLVVLAMVAGRWIQRLSA